VSPSVSTLPEIPPDPSPEEQQEIVERNQCLRVFTLTGDRYETTIVREGSLSPRALPGVEIDVSTLFGGAYTIYTAMEV